MKRITFLLIFTLALFSCSTQNLEQEATRLNISKSEIKLSSLSQTIEVDFDCDGKWKASCDADWITLHQEQGNAANSSLKLDIDYNLTNAARVALIELSAGAFYETILINQLTEEWIDPDPQDVTLEVQTKDKTLPYVHSKFNFEFSTNAAWKVSSNVPWISFSESEGRSLEKSQSITCIVGENQSRKDTRTAIITISAGGQEKSIQINQEISKDKTISDHFSRVYKDGYSYQYICAHRANTYDGIYLSYCPENSVAAVEKCIELGMDMVEIDARLTKDGVVVCCHDAHISNVTNGTGNIADLTYEQICKYSLKIRETGVVVKSMKINTLKEVLLACKDRIWVNLDFSKDRSTGFMNAAIAVLKETGMLEQCTLYVGTSTTWATNYYNASGEKLSIDFYVGSDGNPGTIGTFKTVPILQFNNSWSTGDRATAYNVRKNGYCGFSNMLNFDNNIKNNKTEELVQFVATKIDYMQTDFGDHKNLKSYLTSKGLR